MMKKTIRTWAMMGVSALLLISVAGCGNIPATTPGGQALACQDPANLGVGCTGTARPVDTYWLYSVAFPTATTGYAVGDYGTLLTYNAGKWTPYKWADPTRMQDFKQVVFAANGQNGIAVGNFGEIVTTKDGGTTWTIVTSGYTAGATSVDLNGVAFVPGSNTVAYVAGDGGTVMMTNDAGATWMTQTSGTTLNLEAVSFGDAKNGIAVGDYGQTLVTKDGGSTWTSGWVPTESWLKTAAWAAGTSTVYVAGNAPSKNGVAAIPGTDVLIFKSTDGGASWTAQDSGVTGDVNSLYAKDANNVVAAANDGVLATTDGNKWNTVYPDANSGGNWWLTGITLAPDGHLWAVGTPDTAAGSLFMNTMTVVRSKTTGFGDAWWTYPNNATADQQDAVNQQINLASGGHLMGATQNNTPGPNNSYGVNTAENYAPGYVGGSNKPLP